MRPVSPRRSRRLASSSESGKAPRRSVLFVAVTGEEYGLLGAGYLAAHPTVPANQIVGLVNLDMPLLLYDFTDVVAFGAEHSTIAKAVATAGAGMKIGVAPDPMPEETLFVRSDHYPFVRQGIPSVFLMTGYGNGGQQYWKRFLGSTYHSVKDDLAAGDSLGGGCALCRAQLPDRPDHGGRGSAAALVRQATISAKRSPRNSPKRSAEP